MRKRFTILVLLLALGTVSPAGAATSFLAQHCQMAGMKTMKCCRLAERHARGAGEVKADRACCIKEGRQESVPAVTAFAPREPSYSGSPLPASVLKFHATASDLLRETVSRPLKSLSPPPAYIQNLSLLI